MRLVVLTVRAADAELAADRLWMAGAAGVEELAAGTGAVQVRAALGGDDAVSLARLGAVPDGWGVSFLDVADEPAQTWREFVRPIDVNDQLVIRPAWCAPGEHTTEIAIDPGNSFGLGDHPTTRLSADAVWRLTRPGDRVLDVGCGSGVLSVVAACRGAATVVAIDVADAAREATFHNAERNGVSAVVAAFTTPVEQLDGVFDLVVANILAPQLVSMAGDLRRLTAPGGRLIVSGVLAERHQHVLDALAPMVVIATVVLDGWAAVELGHR